MANMFNGAATFDKDLTSWKNSLSKVNDIIDMWTCATVMIAGKKPYTDFYISRPCLNWPACP